MYNHYYYIWGLKFSSIYYNESIFEISKNLEARFEFDMGLVSAPYEVAEKLQNSFFSYYMMKNIFA